MVLKMSFDHENIILRQSLTKNATLKSDTILLFQIIKKTRILKNRDFLFSIAKESYKVLLDRRSILTTDLSSVYALLECKPSFK